VQRYPEEAADRGEMIKTAGDCRRQAELPLLLLSKYRL
jgi:hypothetical protein